MYVVTNNYNKLNNINCIAIHAFITFLVFHFETK